MSLDREWIAAHIPHHGIMCLLDEVVAWTDADIRCRTASHRMISNPLRSGNHLKAVCGIEYAAQAMAIHGALISKRDNVGRRIGMLASVRNVTLHVRRLDDIHSDLIVSSTRISSDENALLYDFTISGDPGVLLSGRSTIVLTFSPPQR